MQRLPTTEAAENTAPAVSRSVESSAPVGDRRPDAPILGSTRIVRRVGPPLASRPASMVEPGDVSRTPEASGQVSVEVTPVVKKPAPPVAPAPGVLPGNTVRPLPVGAPASSGPPPADAGPSQRLPLAASAEADRPTVGARAPIQRLDAAPPALTSVTPRAAQPQAPPAIPVRRGVQRAPEPVPPTVRSEVEPVLGEPLDDVKVHRGPEVGEAARAIGAKAFATGGEVFLPDEHGSAATGEGSRILKHELTHVVQQRSLGGSLPSEDSAEGAALEAEARQVGEQDSAPATPTQSLAPPVRARPTAAAPQRLAGVRPPDPVRPLATAAATAPDVARPTPSALPVAAQAAIVAKVQAAAAGAGVPTSTSALGPTASATRASHISPAPPDRAAGRPVGGPVETAQRLPATAPSSPRESGRVSISEVSTEVAPAAAAPDLDSLERQLYPRFRSRLRHDLLSDRERAGRLFDTR